MSTIHEAQRAVFEELQVSIRRFAEQVDRSGSVKMPEGISIVRSAQQTRWEARRIARLAYAVEVLESCDPHYPR